ncbi:MAG: glycosyltransferase family 39 protein [Elusimicrobia bacterium]|nr:glycosyltransferase family 39 protein [Elusimicrobiota bacterium]
MRPLWPAVLLILAAGTGLRLFRLDHSLRIDEGEVWARAQRPAVEILKNRAYAPHADLLAHFSSAWPGGEASLRLPFTLYGIAALFCVFLLGRRLFDDETGLAACALAAFSPYLIGYAQEARYYSVFLFYSLAAFSFLLAAVEPGERAGSRRRALCWAGFVLAHSLNLYTHGFALYPLALCGAYLAFLVAKSRLQGGHIVRNGLLLGCALSSAIIFLICLPRWRGLLLLQSESRGGLTLSQSFLLWHFMPKGGIMARMIEDFGGGGAQAWALLGLAALGAFAYRKSRAQSLSFIGLCLGLPVLSLFVLKARTHFEVRYFIFLAPVYLILSASGIAGTASWLGRSRRGNSRIIFAALTAAIILTGLPSLADYYRLPKARLREAVGYVDAHCSPGDAVVFYPQWDFYWYGYYPLSRCRPFPVLPLLEQRQDSDPTRVVRGFNRIWLGATWIADPIRAEEFGRARRLVEKYYDLEKEIVFHGRPENDDFHLFAYRRKNGPLPAPARASPPEALRPQDEYPSRWIARPALDLNIPETLETAAPQRRGILARLRFPFESVLIRVGRGVPLRQPEYKFDHVLYVWSGTGELSTRRGGLKFRRGDVLSVSGRSSYALRASSAGGTVLLMIPASTTTAAGLSARPLFNAWDQTLLPAGMDGVVSRREGQATVLVRRLKPGGVDQGMAEAPYEAGLSLGLVLQGRISLSRKGMLLPYSPVYLWEGDLEGAWGWETLNLDRQDSLEVKLIREVRPARGSLPAEAPFMADKLMVPYRP